ncbi:hypothetical protein HYQ44_016495 [Verticillium longisporum]|nr:hypothetical protein HYQ44_016495 [Verticillium longisporum]
MDPISASRRIISTLIVMLKSSHRRLSTYHVPRYLEARSSASSAGDMERDQFSTRRGDRDQPTIIIGSLVFVNCAHLAPFLLSSSGACLPATKHSFVRVLERAY